MPGFETARSSSMPTARSRGAPTSFFLWHFDRRWFAPGERIEPVATAIGALGVLVCADGRLPTIARALVDRGATALVMPTAWVTSGRNPAALENVQADLLARVRAYENGVPFVAANKCGSELGMVAYCGKSQIVDSCGEIVALASEREPQTLVASIALRTALPRRTALEAVKARKSRLDRTIRLAISFDPLPDDIDERIELLDDVCALSPDDRERLAALDRMLPVASVDDELVLDPAGLVAFQSRRLFAGLLDDRDRCALVGAPRACSSARAASLHRRLRSLAESRVCRRSRRCDRCRYVSTSTGSRASRSTRGKRRRQRSHRVVTCVKVSNASQGFSMTLRADSGFVPIGLLKR